MRSPARRVRPVPIARLTLGVTLLGCLLPSARGLAQDAGAESGDGVRVIGTIAARSTGEPISAAEVRLVPAGTDAEPAWSGVADADGRFRTGVLPLGRYTLMIEAPSFVAVSHLLLLPEAGIVDLEAQMAGVDFELEPLVVSARRLTKLEREGFFERRAGAVGTFLTREDIEALAPSRLSELFRAIPGARLIPGQSGRGDAIRLRGGCTPTFVQDGIVLSGSVRLDEQFSVAGLEGLEVYQGSSAPARFAGLSTCGVVLLWSRDPVATDGRRLSWKRAFVAVGLVALIVLGAG